jgi:alkanesulfonate monooxygenase SsuD/methylene tetrahydromethanopterin reductase-like flavin-dependent oxidoreductase (luciferase family)
MTTMRFGFIPTEGGGFYPEALAEVERAEALGFDSVWMEEHHGVRDHYWPSPLLVLAGFATRTSRLHLGTDVVVLPFYDPVRAAEDTAVLDVVSAGRVIFGAAIGYKPDEFALYRTPLEGRGTRFEEALLVIQALWTREAVTHPGPHYPLREARIEPKPIQKPHPPLWIGGWGERSLGRAARLADAWVPGPTASLQKLLDARAVYVRELRAAGRPEPAAWPLTRDTVIADTDARAVELAERHLLVNYRDEYGGGKWRHPLIGAEDRTPVDRLDALAADRFIVGGPERCIAQIRRFVDAFGVNHLIFRLFFPGMPHAHILRELELLAREVFPAFR